VTHSFPTRRSSDCPRDEGGWRVIDVWESEGAFWQFFDEKLLPAARELGQPPTEARPTFFAIHNMIVNRS
jgi:hypothetical protein